MPRREETFEREEAGVKLLILPSVVSRTRGHRNEGVAR